MFSWNFQQPVPVQKVSLYQGFRGCLCVPEIAEAGASPSRHDGLRARRGADLEHRLHPEHGLSSLLTLSGLPPEPSRRQERDSGGAFVVPGARSTSGLVPCRAGASGGRARPGGQAEKPMLDTYSY